MKAAVTIQATGRGLYQITDRGVALLQQKPAEITVKTLQQFSEFVEFKDKGSDLPAGDPKKPSLEAVTLATPEESLEGGFQVLNNALAADLLESIGKGSPSAFEQIVVDLLVAMGYGGSVEDAGKVVGKSGDGGIDGVIKQDKLGLDAIYVQAKRWAYVVGGPEIMKFSGSLAQVHANRGIFITTSTFTKDACDYVSKITQKIVLIDGKQLASLMIEHNVGVVTKKTYRLKRLDPDYFDNLQPQL